MSHQRIIPGAPFVSGCVCECECLRVDGSPNAHRLFSVKRATVLSLFFCPSLLLLLLLWRLLLLLCDAYASNCQLVVVVAVFYRCHLSEIIIYVSAGRGWVAVKGAWPCGAEWAVLAALRFVYFSFSSFLPYTYICMHVWYPPAAPSFSSYLFFSRIKHSHAHTDTHTQIHNAGP